MVKKKNIPVTLLLCILSLLLFGCGDIQEGKKGADNKNPSDPSEGTMVSVGTFVDLPFDLMEADCLFAGQSALYHSRKKWESEGGPIQYSIYGWDLQEKAPRLLMEQASQEDVIVFTFMDGKDDFYCFGYERREAQNYYYLKKSDKEGNELWKSWQEDMSSLDAMNIMGGAADAQGRICLYDLFGNLYICGEQGNLLKKEKTSIEKGLQLVQTGTQDIYGYYFSRELSYDDVFMYFKVNMEDGSIGSENIFAPSQRMAVKQLWKGRDNTVYFTGANDLWELNMEKGTAEAILHWDDEYVNVDGSQIQMVSGQEGSIQAVLYDTWTQRSELVTVSEQDRALLAPRDTITLGMTMDSLSDNLSQITKRFNRQNSQWSIKIEEYFSYFGKYDNFLDEFTLDILKGNAPDILDLRAIPGEIMENDKILENLVPYFEESDKVGEEDLLRSVWEGCHSNGEMKMIMPYFTVESFAVEKETLQGRPWNLEAMGWLLDTYPDTDLIYFFGPMKRQILLQFALEANNEIFYDKEKQEGYFKGEAFQELLKAVKAVEEDNVVNGDKVTSYLLNPEDVLNGEVLLFPFGITSMPSFLAMSEQLDNRISWIGYPSEKGVYHKFQSFVLLGINKSSDQKEGAWAFLEYLMSLEVQNWMGENFNMFPVRKEAFQHYITAEPAVIDKLEKYASQEEIRQIYELVENAHIKPHNIYDPVTNIILEESEAYFAGDKSLEEVTDIIQNRVMLYLVE